MSTETRHFVLTPEGDIREFTADQAALIAAGTRRVPEFAGHDMRYMQLTMDDNVTEGELRITTAGARLHFDDKGKLTEAGPTEEDEAISRFEHDAVVQWALRDVPSVGPTFH